MTPACGEDHPFPHRPFAPSFNRRRRVDWSSRTPPHPPHPAPPHPHPPHPPTPLSLSPSLSRRKEEAERAAADKAAKKAAVDAQLALEAAEAAGKLRGAEKVAARKTKEMEKHEADSERFAAQAMEARNIDDAIALLSIATDGSEGGAAGAAAAAAAVARYAGAGGAPLTTTAAIAAAAAEDDAHPEKRMKAAFTKYRERVLPELKAEYPSLRLSQINEMLHRQWGKSPENPMVAAERAKQMAGATAWKQQSKD